MNAVPHPGLDWPSDGPPASASFPLPLRWPSAFQMFEPHLKVDAARAVKYGLRSMLTIGHRRRLLGALARDPVAAAFFLREPRAFYPAMSHLLDRRFGRGRRTGITMSSLACMRAALASTARWRQLLEQGIELGCLPDGTRLRLSTNTLSFHEGLWQLALVDASDLRLYSLSFGFLEDGTVLIGNVQGAATGCDGLAHARRLTAAAEGLRPPFLLVQVLRWLCAEWATPALLGIDPLNHVKGRWNLRADRLRFDYAAFWTDVGGRPTEGGDWALPLQAERRPLESVPPKRRAMYRRRHEWLDAFGAQVRAAIWRG